MSALKYRSDIDGLRALAVVPVLLFHAGVTGFGGGFVGVDVFFVISGYLITSIIVREIDQGSFSIVRFYERRVRRIFPALFAVIAFACIVAPFALLPSELRTLANEVYGALAFVANIVFWRAADYFATSAEQKPLLHTWSLGVEEQFYIFTPIAIWIIARYARKALLPITILLLITSFAACIYFTPIKPSASFYLLPFRAWELLVGSILALGMPRHENRIVN
ncbi:MAG: acyltransferase, partial [Alphaproteobacteria bacterium]|nr:acyltransferase [Alphaproteobacteria bacterium]